MPSVFDSMGPDQLRGRISLFQSRLREELSSAGIGKDGTLTNQNEIDNLEKLIAEGEAVYKKKYPPPSAVILRTEIDKLVATDPEIAEWWNTVFPHEEEPAHAIHPGEHPRRPDRSCTQDEEDAWTDQERAFQAHARHHRIKGRFGTLHPDAAFAIHKKLTSGDSSFSNKRGWGHWNYELVQDAKAVKVRQRKAR